MFSAVNVLELAANPVWTFDIRTHVRKRQAAFFVDGDIGLADGLNLWVANAHRHEEVERWFGAVDGVFEVGVHTGKVDDAELEGSADLLGGESDAFGFVHGVYHVFE